MQKKYFSLFLGLTLFLLLSISSCRREKLEPVNIFSPLPLDNPVTIGTDTTTGDSTTSPIIFDQSNSETTDNGYHTKGTIYTKNTDSIKKYGRDNPQGSYPVAGGDFWITVDGDGNVINISGQASPIFPDIFPFSLFQTTVSLLSDFGYARGELIKQQYDDYQNYPLLDNIYYFFFGLNNFLQEAGIGEAQVGNTSIGFSSVFVDPLDPMFLMNGSISYEGKGSSKSFSLGDILIGISVHSNIPFRPLQYSTPITDIVGNDFFTPFLGNIYLAATIPLDKITKIVPLEFRGEVVLQSNDGGMDFFLNGSKSEFILGGNGKVYLTHDILDYLPADLTLELGHGTVEIDNRDNFEARLAGEYGENLDQNPVLSMISDNFKDFFTFPDITGHVIAYYRDANDFLFYFDTRTNFSFPGLGKFYENYTIFAFSPDSVKYFTDLSLPFGIGDISFLGRLDLNTYDFDMLGQADLSLGFHGVDLPQSHFGFEISSQILGARAWASLNMGYGIVNAQMTGLLTTDELTLTGEISSDIDFGSVQLPTFDMKATVSTKTGILMNGYLSIPYSIGNVNVKGKILKDEIALSGSFESNIQFSGIELPAVEMLLSASSKSGVVIAGKVTMPYNIGTIAARGELTSEKLVLQGSISSNLQIHGFDFPTFQMGARLSTDPAEGVEVYGNIRLPSGLGYANVHGRMSSSEFTLSGRLQTRIDMGFTSLGNKLTVKVSSASGVSMYGKVYFPFGSIYLSGGLNTNNHFWLNGSASFKIKFTDDVYAEARISAGVSNNNVSLSASGSLHVGDESTSVTVHMYVDWANNTTTFTVETLLGDYSVTVDKNGKNVKTGELAVIPLD